MSDNHKNQKPQTANTNGAEKPQQGRIDHATNIRGLFKKQNEIRKSERAAAKGRGFLSGTPWD